MNRECDGIFSPETSLLLTVRMENFVPFRFIINKRSRSQSLVSIQFIYIIFIVSYTAHQAHQAPHFQPIDNNLHKHFYLYR